MTNPYDENTKPFSSFWEYYLETVGSDPDEAEYIEKLDLAVAARNRGSSQNQLRAIIRLLDFGEDFETTLRSIGRYSQLARPNCDDADELEF